MIKKKIEYDLSEFPKIEYETTFDVEESLEGNLIWLKHESDSKWKAFPEWVIKLPELGEKEDDFKPKARKGQKLVIVIKIY